MIKFGLSIERLPQGKDVDSVAICAQQALSFFSTMELSANCVVRFCLCFAFCSVLESPLT